MDIKETVDSMDNLKSSRSIRGCHFPNFEMLDAKIASALNKIIQNSYFKKKVRLEEQKVQLQDRFLQGLKETQRTCFHLSQTKCHKMIRWHTQDLTERKQTDNQRTTLAPSEPVSRHRLASQNSDLRRKVVLISINTSWC